MIVTIDGPAGSGKSTAARGLAARLNVRFLDTGAMYRAVALKCLREDISLDDQVAVGRVARSAAIRFEGDQVRLDGEDVSTAIRTPEATKASSFVASNPAVRESMVELQRQAAKNIDIVTEGRDQGTVVFPNANVKFFVVADPEERARRRQLDLKRQGTDVALVELLQEIQARDARDEGREIAPLKPAEDAHIINTSNLTPDGVLDEMQRIIEVSLGNRGRK
ncbi:MAG: (d)CMP kinase [Planctomycetota bacterium]|nr:(d)CMP kinase [Planctomycetota bacterium]